MDALRIGPIQRLSSVDRSMLEEEYGAIKKRATELAFRLNSANLAVMLPAETLFEIFMHLKHITQRYTRKSKQRVKYGRYHTWTLAAGVCVRWRNVIVGTPALWTDIHILDPTVVSTAIIRSQNMLLDVDIDLQPDNCEEARIAHAWQLIVKHSHRIRCLKMVHMHENMIDEDTPLNDAHSAFPELKVLTLSFEQSVDSYILSQMFHRFCLNPTLGTLDIDFAMFSYSCKLFSSHLRELRLRSVDFDNVTSLESHKILLGALKELNKLRILSLCDTLPLDRSLTSIYDTCTPSGEFPLVLGNTVSLPALQLLEISQHYYGHATPCATLAQALFIRHLALPQSSAVHIRGDMCTPKELGPLIFALKTSLSTPSNAIPICTLGIHEETYSDDMEARSISVICWDKELAITPHRIESATDAPEAQLFDVTLVATCSGEPSLSHIMLPLHRQSIRCLSLYSNDSTSEFCTLSTTTRAVLETATQVRMLLVEAAWAEKLPEMLLRHHSRPPLFPQLHSIHIIRLTASTMGGEDGATTPHGLWMLRLVDALGSRDGADRLKKIFVKKSNGFSRKDIQTLQEYADEVVWNEDE